MSKIKYIIGGITSAQLDSIIGQIKVGNSNGVLILRDPIPESVIEITLLDEVKIISFGEFIRDISNDLSGKD